MTVFPITGARLADLAVKATQAGADWHLPLFRAALRGELAFAIVPPGARLPLRMLDPVRHSLPLVVVLSGDGLVPAGLGDFAQAHRLLRWARFILLHGAGGEAFHYEVATEAARQTGRVLVVETTSGLLPAWIALRLRLAADTPSLVVATKPGVIHPCEAAPAGTVMQ